MFAAFYCLGYKVGEKCFLLFLHFLNSCKEAFLIVNLKEVGIVRPKSKRGFKLKSL